MLVALAVGIGAGFLISTGDDGGGTTTTAARTAPVAPPATGTAPSATDDRLVRTTVTNYVTAAAAGNAGTVCGLEAQGGTVTVTGRAAMAACAAAVGVDLAALPRPADLEIRAVTVDGDTAKATVNGGAAIALVRANDGWLIAGYAPAP